MLKYRQKKLSDKKKKLTGWLILEVVLIMLLFVTIQYGRYFLASVVAVKLLFVSFRYYHLRRLLESYSMFRVFKHLPEEGTFEGQTPMLFEPTRRKKGVLLIHGFSSTPRELRSLTEMLQMEGISYYTPVLTGFGLEDVHLLAVVREQDWMRDAVNAYDVFAANCDEITIVGNSMGALLACHVASKRKVDKLVLTAPYLLAKKKHSFSKKLLIDSPFAWLLKLFNPYVRKGGKPENTGVHEPDPRFAYDVVPVRSIEALWRLQDKVQYENIQAGKTLVLTGKKDNTVENETMFEFLNCKGMKYEKIELEGSGHLVFSGPDALDGVKGILNFIKN